MSDDALSSSVVKSGSAREFLCAVQESAGAKSMMVQLKKGNVSPVAQDLISRLLHPLQDYRISATKVLQPSCMHAGNQTNMQMRQGLYTYVKLTPQRNTDRKKTAESDM